MHGNLPQPVEQMLERKNGMFDSFAYDLKFDSDSDQIDKFCAAVSNKL